MTCRCGLNFLSPFWSLIFFPDDAQIELSICRKNYLIIQMWAVVDFYLSEFQRDIKINRLS